jgi:hypothetical protein
MIGYSKDKERSKMSSPKKYVPKPINTSEIQLNKDIIELLEILARNTHEVWSQQKIIEGWKYGTTLSQEEKITPFLVPYKDLPEEIKQYDRNTALETLKLVIELGYNITKEND